MPKARKICETPRSAERIITKRIAYVTGTSCAGEKKSRRRYHIGTGLAFLNLINRYIIQPAPERHNRNTYVFCLSNEVLNLQLCFRIPIFQNVCDVEAVLAHFIGGVAGQPV